jgi:phospho-N-acetylmuramoyl-pentapeptide-transferase
MLKEIDIQVWVFVITFILTLFTGPILIPLLRVLKFGQTVRDDGPSSHLKKNGTPTMGGLIFIIPMLIISVYFAIRDHRLIPLIFATVGFGAIGFIDDFIKVVRKRKDGLYAGQKMFGLLLVATVFSFYVAQFTDIGTKIMIPFMGMDLIFDLAWAFIPVTVFILIYSTNAFNLTDGLDGLLSGVTMIIAVFFTVVAMTRSEWDYLKVFSAIIAGGCLGFMVFNIHPARVFMGDTGSLALGGAMAATAIMMNMPLTLVIAAGICALETLSVVIQVGFFKLTGRRVFRMAPLHHHFELSGWKETKVVAVFWIITLIFCFIGFLALRIKIF